MKTLFLNRDVWSLEPSWSEALIQAYIVQESRRAGYLVAGDQNAGKRNPGLAAAGGILAGAPDLRYFFPRGRLLQIELKLTKALGGKLSKEQKDLHPVFQELGFAVEVVWADCPGSGWEQCKTILEAFDKFESEKEIACLANARSSSGVREFLPQL